MLSPDFVLKLLFSQRMIPVSHVQKKLHPNFKNFDNYLGSWLNIMSLKCLCVNIIS